MAEERRQHELRRRMDKLHQSRQLYDALQAKNHELYGLNRGEVFVEALLFLDKWPT